MAEKRRIAGIKKAKKGCCLKFMLVYFRWGGWFYALAKK
jgi:hypothetical protein